MAKIGIITTWFGKDIEGGAEKQSYELASRLSQSGHDVKVLTTCLRSFHDDWNKDFYKPSDSLEDGIRVLRFKTAERQSGPFDHVVEKLLKLPQSALHPGKYAASALDESIYWRFGINSPDLLRHLRRFKHEFDAFVLLPYLFPVVADSVMILGEKAYLQPCLHDECYAYLRKVEQSMYWAGKLLFNSKGEQLLAQKIYGDWILQKSHIMGEGVEVFDQGISLESLKSGGVSAGSLGFSDPSAFQYFLCLGKKCAEKNTPLAIEAFKKFRSSSPDYKDFKLVLAGPSSIDLGENSEGIEDWGLVDEKTKLSLLANCRALLIPSVNESFSRVLFEAWFLESPVIVHQECLATRCAVEEAGEAGYISTDEQSWAKSMVELAQLSPQSLKMLGLAGAKYASQVADWGNVIDRYSKLCTPVTVEDNISDNEENDSLQGHVYTQLLTKEPQSVKAANLQYALNWAGIPCEWQASEESEVLKIFYKDRQKILHLSKLKDVFHSEYFQSGTLDSHLFSEWNDDAFHFFYLGNEISSAEQQKLLQFEKIWKKVTGKPIHWFVFNRSLESKFKGAVSTVQHEKIETFLYLSDCLIFTPLTLKERKFWQTAAELCKAPCLLKFPESKGADSVKNWTELSEVLVHWPSLEVDADQSLDFGKFYELMIQNFSYPSSGVREKNNLGLHRLGEKAHSISQEIFSTLRSN